jgi:hypothetical protein
VTLVMHVPCAPAARPRLAGCTMRICGLRRSTHAKKSFILIHIIHPALYYIFTITISYYNTGLSLSGYKRKVWV